MTDTRLFLGNTRDAHLPATQRSEEGDVSTAAALATVTACGGTLRRLEFLGCSLQGAADVGAFGGSLIGHLSQNELDNVLSDAPHLVSFNVDVRCDFEDAQTLLGG